MRTIHFNSYKIAKRIPLLTVSSCFGMNTPESWENCIILAGPQLNTVFKCRTHLKYALLFDFGSVVFVNFNPEEARKFLQYLESIMDGVDYGLFARFSERHSIKVQSNGSFSLARELPPMEGYSDSLIPVIASVLAKSPALDFIETDMEKLLDEAEGFISYMQKGRLHSKDRKYAAVTAHLLRFRYELTSSIRIFDRPSEANASLLSRTVYDRLAGFYELFDRFNILESKTQELGRIARAYSDLSYRRRELRLIMIEVFLLALFPLSYFAGSIVNAKNIQSVLHLFIR